MSSLVSHQNKEFLWGILAEEGVFDGIPANVSPDDIKRVFEQILKNLSANIPGLYAAKLKELHNAKQRSIADEDYDAAKKIHATIGEMEAIFPRLEKLEARKHQAIQAEDFESAKQLKCEIERVRAASFSLKDINRIAIQSLAIHIPKAAREISAKRVGIERGGVGGIGGGSAPFPEVAREIYNAEDFHSQKREEIETKLREKEAEMRSYFETPRPKEIDFSDVPRDVKLKSKIIPSTVHRQTQPVPSMLPSSPSLSQSKIDDEGSDSPLADNSDDMDKIIAERIASRQRDLDDITAKIKASMPPEYKTTANVEYNPNDVRGGGDDTQPNPMIPLISPIPTSTRTQPVSNEEEGIRRVRFQDEEQSI
jgi:hypothetical protein